ncbi:hypothetical protein GCM10027421_16830 [Microbacterium shaanxiense]
MDTPHFALCDAALDPVTDADAIRTAGADSFVDASGAAAAVRSGIDALRPGGRAVLVGMGLPELALPITQIQNKELVLTGVFRYANTCPPPPPPRSRSWRQGRSTWTAWSPVRSLSIRSRTHSNPRPTPAR